MVTPNCYYVSSYKLFCQLNVGCEKSTSWQTWYKQFAILISRIGDEPVINGTMKLMKLWQLNSKTNRVVVV